MRSHLPDFFVLILDPEREQLPFANQRCLPFELVVKSVEVFVDVDARNIDTFHTAVGLADVDSLWVKAADSVRLSAESTDHVSTVRAITNAVDRPVFLCDFTTIVSLGHCGIAS